MTKKTAPRTRGHKQRSRLKKRTLEVVKLALAARGGNVTKAARMLGMSRHALSRILAKDRANAVAADSPPIDGKHPEPHGDVPRVPEELMKATSPRPLDGYAGLADAAPPNMDGLDEAALMTAEQEVPEDLDGTTEPDTQRAKEGEPDEDEHAAADGDVPTVPPGNAGDCNPVV